MAVATPLNRVKVATATTGTGTVTLSSAESGFATFGEASGGANATVTYLIEDGDDFEIGQGTYTHSGTTLSRNTVYASKISGTHGTSKINLSGSAKVSCAFSAADVTGNSPIGKHAIWVPASAMILATTSAPTSAQFESTTNDRNIKRIEFDDASDKHAHFNVMLPPSWNLGTVTYKVAWMTTATDTDSTVWAVEATSIADGESIDTSWGTAVTVSDAAQSSATELLISAESGALTIAGSPAAGELAFFRIYRDVSADTITEAVQLVGVTIFFTTAAATDA